MICTGLMVLIHGKIVSGARGASHWTRWLGILVLRDSFMKKTMQMLGTIQWHIWEPGIVFSNNEDQQLERVIVQALLEDKQFLAGRTIITSILIFHLRRLTKFIGEVLGIAQFCSSSFKYDFGLRSLGEKARLQLIGKWGAQERQKGNAHLWSKREKKKRDELVESGGLQGRERPTIINREKRLSFGKSLVILQFQH